jgi:hypothetical protein
MPFAAEVDSFQTEIGGDQRFVPAGKPDDSTIITNAVEYASSGAHAPADAVNQELFREWQDEINIFPF